MANQEQSDPLERYRELLKRKKAAREKMLDERYADAVDYAETEEERTRRVMGDPDAWTKL